MALTRVILIALNTSHFGSFETNTFDRKKAHVNAIILISKRFFPLGFGLKEN